MKKISKVFRKMIILAFVLAVGIPFGAFAQTAGMSEYIIKDTMDSNSRANGSVSMYPGQNFKVYSFDMTGKSSYTIQKINGAKGVQLQLLSGSKKPLASGKAYFKGKTSTTLTLTKGIKPQRFYYYKVRAIYSDNSYGKWSGFRAFSTYKVASFTKSGWNINVKLPGAEGVKGFEIWTSAKSNKEGFSRVGIFPPGKTIVFSKINGKSIQSYGYNKVYYFHIRPILNTGVNCHYKPCIISSYSIVKK